MSELASLQPLAYLQQRLRRVCETQPTVAVHSLVGAAEMISRFLVAAASGELARGTKDGRAALGERPTLERWLKAARELTKRVDEARSTPTVPCLPEAGRLLHELSLSDAWDPPEMAGPSGVVKLRNWLAHVGVPGDALAQKLVPPLNAAFETVFAELARLFDGVEVRCDRDGEGPHVYLAGPAGVVDLWPIFRYEVPGYGMARREDAQPVMQVFVRVERELPQYEVLDDDSIFAVGTGLEAAAYRERFGESTPGFWRDAHAHAEKRIGRRSELEQIAAELGAARAVLSDTHPAAVRWLLAPMGTGKSLVAACAAVQEREREADKQVLLHIFRAGDSRCSVTSFVDRALEELGADVFERDPKRRRRRLMAILRERRPTIICDGLDEVESEVRGAVRQLLDIADKGGVWLMSGRPHPAFEETGFPGKNDIFECRFPRMEDTDLRSMLFETAPVPVRDALLEDVNGRGQHYVDQVVKTADGSPQYLSLAIEWLASLGTPDAIKAQVRVGAVPGVTALYDELFDQWGASDIGSVKDLVLCTVAQAREPLGAEALAEVVYHGHPMRDEAQRERRRQLCAAALRAFSWTLEVARDSDGRTGIRVVHESARKHLATSDRHAEDWSNTRALLAKVCRDPATVSGEQLRRHAYRYGVSYAFANGDERDVGRMIARYGYLRERLRELGHNGVDSLVADLQRAAEAASGRGATAGRLAEWRRLLTGKAHLLRRGTDDWGAERIFQQLAWEEGPETPPKAPALHSAWPGGSIRPNPALLGTLPLERTVTALVGVARGRVVLMSADGSVEMFAPNRDVIPRLLLTLRYISHSLAPDGRMLINDQDIVYAVDPAGEISEWRSDAGGVQAVAGLRDSLVAAVTPGRLHVLRLAREGSGPIATLEGQAGDRLLPLSDGAALLVWDQEGQSAVYSTTDHAVHALPPQPGLVEVLEAQTGVVVLATSDRELVVCDVRTGKDVARSGRRETQPHGPCAVDGALMWAERDEVFTWNPQSNRRPQRLRPLRRRRSGRHKRSQFLVLGTSGGVLATVSAGARTVRLWSPGEEREVGVLEGHWGDIEGMLETSSGHLATWGQDGTIRTWDPQTRAPVAQLAGHTGAVLGVVDGRDGTLVSLAEDRTLRWWDVARGVGSVIKPALDGVLALSGNVLLAWSRPEPRIRTFEVGTGRDQGDLRGHRAGVRGVVATAPDTAVSWADDGEIRVWRAGRRSAVERGKADGIDCVLPVDRDHIVAWSEDGYLGLGPLSKDAEEHVLWESDKAGLSFEVFTDWPWLAAWSTEDPVRAWRVDPASGEGARPSVTPIELVPDTGRVRGARILADARLITWSGDGTLRVWDLRTGQGQSTIGDPHDPSLEEPGVADIGGDRLVTWAHGGLAALWDFSLHVYDMASGRKLHDLRGHRAWIEDARAFGSGQVLSWSGDGTLRMWDVESGESLRELSGHFGPVVGVIRARDAIASWSSDGTVRVWDPQLRSLRAVAMYETSPHRAPAWSAETSTLVFPTTSGDPLALSGEALGLA